MNNGPTPSRVLALFAWISFFTEAWGMLSGKIEITPAAGTILVMFLLIGFISSIAVPKKETPNDKA